MEKRIDEGLQTVDDIGKEAIGHPVGDLGLIDEAFRRIRRIEFLLALLPVPGAGDANEDRGFIALDP